MQLAMKQMEGASLTMLPSFDIWQLGLMVYEAMVGPYWPLTATDAMILHRLATRDAKLPHETTPAEPVNVANMLKVQFCSCLVAGSDGLVLLYV
jgi:hypothetical protein